MSNYKRSKNTDKSNSGIYSILNTHNGKRYVGQTYDLNYRWNRHRFDLNHNYHSNKHLQNAWNKYGSSVFKYSVLEKCAVEQLDERELWWINHFDCLNNGYNQASGGIGCRGYKHTDEEIRKMRMAYNPDAVLQLDRDLNIIARWESASQAAKELGIWGLAIRNCCKKERYVKSVGGFVWVYEKDYSTIDAEYYLRDGTMKPREILQFDLNMNLITVWSSIYVASKESGFNHRDISRVASYKRKTASGYLWRFNDDYSYEDYLEDLNTEFVFHNTSKVKVVQYDLCDNQISVFNSISGASKETGISLSAIRNSCKNQSCMPKMFKWKYA